MQLLKFKNLLILFSLTIFLTLTQFCTPQPDFNDSQKIEMLPLLQNSSDNSSLLDSGENMQSEAENIQVGIADSAKPNARFFVYYGDTTLYNPKIIISEATCTGTRVPVQIRASTNGFDTLIEFDNEFLIELNPWILQAFKSDAAIDTVPINSARLVNGIKKIYIQAKTPGSIRDGMITIFNLKNGQRILSATRSGINFTSCITGIRVIR